MFFLFPEYDRENVEGLILKSGYNKHSLQVFSHAVYNYVSGDGKFIINLTSPIEGKIQIQGEAVEDLYKKRKASAYYSRLEQLVAILKPDKVVDDNIQDFFETAEDYEKEFMNNFHLYFWADIRRNSKIEPERWVKRTLDKLLKENKFDMKEFLKRKDHWQKAGNKESTEAVEEMIRPYYVALRKQGYSTDVLAGKYPPQKKNIYRPAGGDM